MLLQEVFNQLTFGELSQLSIGGGEAGVIDSTNHHRIIPHVNLALGALYSRFPLKEGRATVALLGGKYTYALQVEDLNRIGRVFTAKGHELTLNDELDRYSCFTVSSRVLTVPVDIVDGATNLPEALITGSLDITYRANHPKLQEIDPDFDPDEIELELPYTHLNALLYFIAARMLAPTGSGQFEGLVSNSYIQKYEREVQLLTANNPQVELTSNTTGFRRGGWS